MGGKIFFLPRQSTRNNPSSVRLYRTCSKHTACLAFNLVFSLDYFVGGGGLFVNLYRHTNFFFFGALVSLVSDLLY